MSYVTLGLGLASLGSTLVVTNLLAKGIMLALGTYAIYTYSYFKGVGDAVAQISAELNATFDAIAQQSSINALYPTEAQNPVDPKKFN